MRLSLTRSVPGAEEFDVAWQATIGSIAAARRPTGEVRGEVVGVTVLTGFLGSGKTTILRRLLAEPAGLRIAAVVNDIGPINIDAAAINGLPVASLAPERIELTNGCACCALVDDLADTLEQLVSTRTSDAIVVEASGIADPGTMAAAVETATGCRLDGVVAVIDAQQLAAQLDDPRIAPAVRRQIDVSHVLVLSKVDGLDDAAVSAVTRRISEIAPGRMVVPSVYGRIDPRVLLSAAMRGATFHAASGDHPIEVAAAVVDPAGPWEVAAVARWLDDPPEPLLRAKGLFTSPDGTKHELQSAGRQWRIDPATTPSESAIVLIGLDDAVVDRAATSLHHLNVRDALP